jgi:hypothetical protein
MLYTCQFCNDRYFARPQVKNPRACGKAACQAARQKANEREWREKNASRYDAHYYRKWRKDAYRRRLRLRDRISQALKIGLAFRNDPALDFDLLMIVFHDFLQALGMRTVNKFCNA